MIYYLLAILNNINSMIGLFFAISIVATAILTTWIAMIISNRDKIPDGLKKIHKIAYISFIICSILGTFIPTQKQAAFIILAPAIVENKDVQDTLKNIPEIAKLGTEYLKEMLKTDEVKE